MRISMIRIKNISTITYNAIKLLSNLVTSLT